MVTTIMIKIEFLDGMKIDQRSIKELKNLKKKVDVPKKGFFHKKKKLREIHKAKKIKKIYQELIDMYGLLKKLKGKVLNNIVHYWEHDGDKIINYSVFILEFSSEEKKQKFEEMFFDLYPELNLKE